MIGYVLIVTAILLLVAITVHPKIGAVLILPIVFLYPHLYMQRLNLLPWNIGIDDLFICVFFVVVVVRRNLIGGIPVRLGLAGVGVTTYFVIWTVANLSGWSMMPELPPEVIVKEILKVMILILFTYCLVHTIDTARDLQQVVFVFILTLTCAGITLILHRMFPYYFSIFSYGKFETLVRDRPTGSLANPNVGSIILGMTVVLAIARARLEAHGPKKIVLLGCIPVLLTSIAMAKSRSGVASLGGALLLMALFSRHRRYALLLLCSGVLVVVFRPDLFFEYWERITSLYNPDVEQLGSGAATRIEGWAGYWRTSTAQVWLLGQGFQVGVFRVGMHAHNTAVSALFVHGLGGLVWALLFFGTIFRRTWWLARNASGPDRAIASGIAWSMLIWLVGGIGLDMITQVNARYTYFFCAVVAERLYALTVLGRRPEGEGTVGNVKSPRASVDRSLRPYTK